MNIGDNIKSFRKHKKLTQKKLGELINKKEITIRKYENGSILPPIDVLLKISDVIQIPYLDLIKDTEYDNSEGQSRLIFPGTDNYINKHPYDPVKEFENVNEDCSEDEKAMILNIVKHYNYNYCNNRYDLSNINDEHMIDLKVMFYTTIKTVLRNCIKKEEK